MRVYLSHTENGRSLREIARDEGVHASTILRQVRRFENRRDDPLVDCALGRLKQGADEGDTPDEAALRAEARRILPRLAEEGALLVVAPDMDRAVVLRDGPGGAVRLAVLDRVVAEAFALRDWIHSDKPGRVARYEITAAGRAEARRLRGDTAPDPERRKPSDFDAETPRSTRPVTTESPVAMLARRRDRDGKPFLAPDLVAAAERLREDFEIGQMGQGPMPGWERLLSGPVDGGTRGARIPGGGQRAARERLRSALDELGPGLADLALRCCCHLEGLETAERQLGWSARSGKIVLRIALLRLRRHYDALGDDGCMLG